MDENKKTHYMSWHYLALACEKLDIPAQMKSSKNKAKSILQLHAEKNSNKNHVERFKNSSLFHEKILY